MALSRDHRTHIIESSFLKSRTAQKHLTREEFGRRVYTAMLAKNWTQAELARQAKVLPDSVSNYVRGAILPSPQNLKKLAEALDVTVEDLLPNYTEGAIEQESEPAFDMKVSAADPKKAWLRVNRLVNFTTAIKVGELLNEEDAANRN